ncbi:MAG: PA0069 family radical SAM protein [Candidatus Eremiobacteraeota bacterium]|nr:PA0069 family radical SAM protein [Candidatus Eremiobacteraeota bacterium]
MWDKVKTARGRGASGRIPNRFEQNQYEPDPEYLEWQHQTGDEEPVKTKVHHEATRSVISRNKSPDISFSASLNPYRGCEHGCSYCYARPTHEYLGFSAGLDFESRILAKHDAPGLLKAEFDRPRYQPETLVMSGVTDAYQPLEKKLGISRGCLEVLVEYGHPVVIITKNRLVTRDADLLAELARRRKARVWISITSLQPELARVFEPRASSPENRLAAIAELHRHGIPVGVMTAPIVPGLNDHEVPAILSQAAKAGASFASFTAVRLPLAVAPLFLDWLERHFPERRDKVVHQIEQMRGGKLNQSEFHQRFKGSGPVAEHLRRLFELGARRAGLTRQVPDLEVAGFRPPGPAQLSLFED